MSVFAIANLLQNFRAGNSLSVTDHLDRAKTEGLAFYVEGNSTMSDTQDLWVELAAPPGQQGVMTLNYSHSGILSVKMYEDCSTVSGGTTKTFLNFNRGSTHVTKAQFSHGVVTTSTAAGTQIMDWKEGGEAKFSRTGGGGEKNEVRMKAGSRYLTHFESESTGQILAYRYTLHRHVDPILSVAD